MKSPSYASCIAGLALFLGSVTCAPAPTRSAPMAPVKRAPTVNWLSKNPRGQLVLPRTVDVHLTDLDKSTSLSIQLASGKSTKVIPSGRGVQYASIAARESSPTQRNTSQLQLTIAGPVVIEGRTHEGTLVVERHPELGLRASVTLPLETYIAGVVAAELPIWSAAPAELEALAIAARTFAVSAIAKRRTDGQPAQLTDGVMDQAYRGTYSGKESSGSRAVADRLQKAVARTEAMVVIRGDRLEETRYHASCGGHTANFADVFESEVQRYDAHGPTGVPCKPCAERAAKEQAERGPDPKRPLSWIATVEPDALARAGAKFQLAGPIQRIEPTQRDVAGRWLEVRITGPKKAKHIRFDALRAALGYKSWNSGMIDVLAPAVGTNIPRGTQLRVQGRGRGHGVGLCQESARDYARAGWTAHQILSHYYPGTSVRRIEQAAPQP